MYIIARKVLTQQNVVIIIPQEGYSAMLHYKTVVESILLKYRFEVHVLSMKICILSFFML